MRGADGSFIVDRGEYGVLAVEQTGNRLHDCSSRSIGTYRSNFLTTSHTVLNLHDENA